MTTSRAVAEDAVPQEGGHWSNIARLWRQVGSPLRPTPADVAVYSRAVRDWARAGGAPRALILGVTPELYRLPWPEGSDVAAVDRNRNMIDALWPGPRDAVVCADWRELPFPSGSRDVAVCDGGLSMLSYPEDHREFVRSLRRVVAPGGLCVFRLYVPPEIRESPEAVLGDLLGAKVPNLNVLKLRLGMALQESGEGGVELGHVWDVLRGAAPDFPVLAGRIGWPLEHLLAIDTYRGCASRYHFPSIEDVRSLFCASPGGFELASVHTPTYTLGERCPLVVFRRAG